MRVISAAPKVAHMARLRDLDLTVLIPVKSPQLGKSRLKLSSVERADASWTLVSNTVHHLASLHPILVVNDHATATWLEPLGQTCWIVAASGLNDSLAEAYRQCRSPWVLVAHSDLANPELVLDLETDAIATVWRDQHGDGTPLFLLPSGLEWTFRYGPNSSSHHDADLTDAEIDHVVRDGVPAATDIDNLADYIVWHQRKMEGAEAPSINP